MDKTVEEIAKKICGVSHNVLLRARFHGSGCDKCYEWRQAITAERTLRVEAEATVKLRYSELEESIYETKVAKGRAEKAEAKLKDAEFVASSYLEECRKAEARVTELDTKNKEAWDKAHEWYVLATDLKVKVKELEANHAPKD